MQILWRVVCVVLVIMISSCSDVAVEAVEIGDLCSNNTDCDEGNLYCETPAGECGATGQCQSTDLFERAESCEECDGWCNVCGCDGVTYANLCAARNAGASVAYYGKCDGESCIEDVECHTDSYPEAEQSRYCDPGEGVCWTHSQE